MATLPTAQVKAALSRVALDDPAFLRQLLGLPERRQEQEPPAAATASVAPGGATGGTGELFVRVVRFRTFNVNTQLMFYRGRLSKGAAVGCLVAILGGSKCG